MAVTVYQFGEFTLDCAKFELSRKGRRLKLERKPLELLVLLVAEHGQIVTREKIANCLWTPEVFVDIEHGVNTAVRKIRQTLGDTPELPRFVQTISGSGYRFIASVTTVEPEIAEPASAPEVPAASIPAAATLPAATTPDDVQPEAPPGMTALPEGPSAPISPSASRSRFRFWGLTASGALVVLTIAGITFGLGPFAFRFDHRQSRATISSIAVLPLQNLSGDPAQQYFADGMTDELTTELARIPHLRVASSTSVRASMGAHRPLPEIARQLQVDAIVEGSIMRSGERVRITAQLIDARTDRHLWAQSFEGSASDVLFIQDSVSQQIASQASFVLTPPAPRAPVNPDSHDAYLRGRYFFHKQDFSRSLEYFQQAVALDPGYASAHAGYASALEAATTFNIGSPEQFMPKALAEAQRAIQIDPRNGEAYTVIGSVQTIYAWDWTAAEQNLSRGIALSPGDSIAEFKYAVYLDAIGRTQDAVTHMRRALDLDPLSFLINLRLGISLYYDGQYDAALAQLQRAAEMERSSSSVDYYLTLVYEQKGERDEAVKHKLAALRQTQPQLDIATLLDVYRQHGWQSYWRALALTLNTAANPCNTYEIGIDDLRIEELGHAFDAFQHAIDRHCFSMTFIRVNPLFDPVRHDPRYAALMRRMTQ